MSSLMRTIRTFTLLALCVVFACGGYVTPAHAAPKYTINYQGKLTTTSGVAVTNGTYNMRFWLLTGPATATTSATWTESRTGGNKVTVQNGLFSVMLGDVSSLSSINFNQTLYLGVEIGGTGSPAWDGEMSPRKILGTVPSAFEAKQLGGVASTSFLRSDQADSASSLLTFTGGLISSASSTVSRLSFLNATGTSLYIGGDRITDFTGTGLALSGNSLTATLGTDITAAEISNGDHGFFSYSSGVASLDTGGLTSNNLLTALTDETGTGSSVFNISPSLYGTASVAALTATSTVTLSGTAANIALGSNFLSGDGADEGVSVDTIGRTNITSVSGGLNGILTLINTSAVVNSGNTLEFQNSSSGMVQVVQKLTSSGNSDFYFNVRGSNVLTERFRITSVGNVGIGSSTPDTRLFVSGAVKAGLYTATSTTGTSTFPRLNATQVSFGGDYITDFTGTGIVISGSSLTTTLGTSIAAAEIADGDHGFFSYSSGVASLDTGGITSNNLLTALTDETGTGVAVFGTSPTISGATLSGFNNTFTSLTASRALFLGSGSQATTTATSAFLLNSLTDETGTGVAVFGTSPTFTTFANFGSAGVRITDDADGAITFLGLGNGTDEDLTMNLDDTSNEAVFTTSTGVTKATFTSIALNTTSALGYQISGTTYLNQTNGNLLIGPNAGGSGTQNIIIGSQAGDGMTGGDDNNFIGYQAGRYNSGYGNNILGSYSGTNNTGDYNDFIGLDVGDNNTGDYNQFIGVEAGKYLQSTTSVALGAQALYGSHATTYISLNNVALGYRAGYASDDGSGQNILLGYQAADNLTTGNNNIIIGYDIDNVTATADNRLNIGNLIFGTGLDGTGTTLASGNIGIGTTSPYARLSVNGRIVAGFMTATSTTATSTFPRLNASQVAFGSDYITDFTGTGIVISGSSLTASLGTSITAAELADGDHGFFSYASGVATLDTGGLTSNNLLTALTDETGTGVAVFGTNPTLTGTGITFTSLTASRALFLGSGSQATTTATSAFLLNSLTDETGTGVAVFGTDPTFTTSLTAPLIYGGTAVGSSLSLQSTSGAGTTDFIRFLVGNSGATEAARFTTAGNFGIGTTTPAARFTVQAASGSSNLFSFATSTGSSLFSMNRLGTLTIGASTTGSIFINGGPTTINPKDMFRSTVLGNQALTFAGTGATDNIAIGYRALYGSSTVTMTGDNNVAVGNEAGAANTTGYGNSFVGSYAGTANTTGFWNSFFGHGAGSFMETGSGNNFFGVYAGSSNSGSFNNFIGNSAGSFNSGSDNTYLGNNSGDSLSTGSFNTLIGSDSGGNILTGTANTAVGYRAGRGGNFSQTFASSTFIGYGTGLALTTGSRNILLGYQAGDAITTGANNLIIGYDIDAPNNTTSNQLNIGNIFFGSGVNTTGTTVDNDALISIGDSSPDARLDVDYTLTSATAATSYNTYFTVTDTGVVTTGTDTTYGNRNDVTRTGATGGTLNNYGGYTSLTGTFASGSGTLNNYGQYIDVTSSVSGTSQNTGLYVNVTGADTNYAALLMGGNVGINDTTPDANLDMDVASSFPSGTLFGASAPSAVSVSGVTGFNMDLATNFSKVGNNFAAAGYVVTLPSISGSVVGVDTYQGLTVTGGAITASSGSGNSTFTGAFITNSNLTQTTGTLASNGVSVTTGTNTTGGTQQGLNVIATGVGAGTLNAVNIGTITAGAGTENAIVIGTGWDTILDTATLDITGAGAITGATGFNGLVITANTGVITTGTWNATAITSTYLDTAVILSTEIDTSSELAAILTDETGTGRSVFSISPAFSGTPTFAALTATSTLTLSGSAANIALGSSNFLNGDSDDEGFSVDTAGRATITSTSGAVNGILTLYNTSAAVGSGNELAFKGGTVDYSSITSVVSSSGNGRMQFNVRSANTLTEAARILANLNFGVGTTSPVGRLSVNRTDSDSSASNSFGIYNAISDTGVVTTGTDNNYGNRTEVTRTGATGGTLNNYGAYTTLTGTFASGSGTINNYGQYIDVTGSAAGTSNNIGLSVNVASADTNYAALFNGGNIGIGTTTPQRMLHVYSAAGPTNSQFRISAGVLGGMDFGSYSVFNNTISFGADYTGGQTIARSTIAAGISQDSSGFSLTANNGLTAGSPFTPNERLYITYAGNVGIGDTTPAALFTVGSGDLFQINSSGVIASSNNITPNSVKSTGQTDEYCLTYETTGTTFEWQVCGAGYLTSADIDTSSELLAILTDETGTGRSVFSISPAFSGTPTFAALTASSTLTLSGTAANIALGSNYLSGDGDDEGILIGATGAVDTGVNITTGSLYRAGAGGPITLTGDLTGFDMDLSSSYTSAGFSLTGYNATLRNIANNGAGSYNYRGFVVSQGALAQAVGAGTNVFTGAFISNPAVTQSAGSVTANGVSVTTGTITTGGTQQGFNVIGQGVGAGTLNGLNIANITGGAGTENAIKVGAGWDSVFNSVVLNVSGTGGTQITPLSTFTSGTIFSTAAGAATTLSGALTGINLNLSGGYTATGFGVTGYSVTLPNVTNTGTAVGYDYRGLTVTGGAITQTTAAGTNVFTGAFITNSNLTQTTGTLSANGVSVTTGTNTTGGTQNGFNVIGQGVGAGTLNGINIANITGGAGTENAINVGTGYDKILETTPYDIAGTGATTINPLTTFTIGNIITVAAGGATTLTGALTGFNMDLSTNYTATGFNMTGYDVTLPAVTNVGGSTYTYRGLTVTGGALTQTTAGGSDTFTGAFITNPNITTTVGSVTASGVTVTNGTITTAGNQYGFNVIASGVTTGTLNAFRTNNITGGTGVESAFVVGSGWDYAFDSSGFDIAGNGVTTIGSSITTGTVVSMVTSGITLTGAYTGINLNLNTAFTATGFDVTGYSSTLPAVTNTGVGSYAYRGLQITGGALTQTTGAGTNTFTGAFITNSNLTQTTGTLSANGVTVTTGTNTTGGTQQGFNVIGQGVAAGTLNGLNITNITGGAGTENAINIGTGYDNILNTTPFDIAGTGATVIAPLTTFNQGAVLSIGAGGVTTMSTSPYTGIRVDLNTSFTNNGSSVTGQSISLPAISDTGAQPVNYYGIDLTGGTITRASGGGSDTWYGYAVVNPNLTQTSGTLSAYGAHITTGFNTTGGTQYGANIAASGIGAGTLLGINISAITAGAGTENAIVIGTGWDKILDTGSIDISGTGAVTDATSYNGLVITANTGVITTGTWNATAITSTYLDTAVILSTEIDTSAELLAILTDETGTGAAVFGTSPTFTTALTAPLIYGGSAAGSGLTLQSTSGAGTTDFIKFLVGNAGATESMRILSNGKVGIASTTPWRTLSVVGTVALNGLSAVAGTDNSVCIDPTTFEITTQAGDTCAVSAARYKHDINPLQNGDGGLAMLKKLDAVSYKYNNDTTNTKYWGLIADQAASTSPQLAYFNPDGSVQTLNTFGFLALFTESIQELNLNLETIASTTGSSTVQSRLFATSFFERVGQWLGETTNGIKQLYAEKVETKELCVADDSGDKTCITKSQLDNLLEAANAPAAASEPDPESDLTPEPDLVPNFEPPPEPVPEPPPNSEGEPVI